MTTTKDKKADEAPPTFGTDPLPQEVSDVIFSGPAVFANRIFVTMSALGVRVTFIEQQEGSPPQFRTAAYLNILDGMALRDLLNAQFEKLKLTIEGVSEDGAAAPEENGD